MSKAMTVKDLPRLAKAITDDYTTGQRCAVSMCYNIGYAWEIWHQRDDDEGFWQWLEHETPSEFNATGTARKYLQIYKNVLSESLSDLREVPITKLLELSRTVSKGNQNKEPKPALPKQKRDSLLKKLTSDNPPTTKEIKEEVKKALPEKIVPIQPVYFHYPPFDVRLQQTINDEFMSPEKAARLFGLSIKAHIDDIKIITRHWKQKYHPDKGGTDQEYQKICRAEEVFTASQKEKEVAA